MSRDDHISPMAPHVMIFYVLINGCRAHQHRVLVVIRPPGTTAQKQAVPDIHEASVSTREPKIVARGPALKGERGFIYVFDKEKRFL